MENKEFAGKAKEIRAMHVWRFLGRFIYDKER